MAANLGQRNGSTRVRATVYDVARLAGVSPATVSRVVRGSAPVREATRRRVKEAIAKLNYQPNLLASALMTRQTDTIGVLVPDISNPFFAEVVRGIEDAAQRLGISIMICNTDHQPEKEEVYVSLLRRKGVDGLIVTPTEDAGWVRWLDALDVPLVLLARDLPGVEAGRVWANDRRGGYLATRHLIEHGHTAIAMVAEPFSIPTSRLRAAGYRQALEEAGLNPVGYIIEADGSGIRHGVAAGARLFDGSRGLPITALFAANDLLAVGVMQEARRRGLQIPQDLSIVGFDGTVLASVIDPPLTSVGQPMGALGREAVSLVLELRDGKPARSVVLEPSLILGGTTAPAPTGG